MTADPGTSRAATDALLAVLSNGRWRPSAWERFLRHAAQRSIREACARPRAVAELTALHAGIALLAGARRPAWTLTSWALAVAHLGMLEGHGSIGWANAITLTRANLPALPDTWWLPVVAVATDVADGRIARTLAAESRFGAAADALADATFWTWYAVRHEPSRVLRAAALLAWATPAVAVTVGSIRRGRMIDAPRPTVLRPAAVLQAILTARCLIRECQALGVASAGKGPAESRR